MYSTQGFLQTAMHAQCVNLYSEIFISFLLACAVLHLLTKLHQSHSTFPPPLPPQHLCTVALDVKFALLISVAL